MTEVQFRRLEGGTFVGIGPSNHWVVMDTAEDEAGHNGGPRPMELVLMALGSCSGIDVELMLRKMRVPLQDFRIEISGKRAEEHPRVYTSIKVAYHFWGHRLPKPKLERAVAISQETYCSVNNMLNKVVDMTTEVVAHEVAPSK